MLIVFDFDGVIVDSMPAQAAAWEKAFDQLGRKLSSEQRSTILSNFWNGKSGRRIFDGAQLSEEIARSLRKSKNILWKRAQSKVCAMPHAVRGLNRLKHRFTLSVATSSPLAYVESILDRLAISDVFRLIVTEEDVDHPKPAPDALEKVAGHFGESLGSLLVVGDTAADRQMAQAAGSEFIMYDSGKRISGVELPHRVVTNWLDLQDEIEEVYRQRRDAPGSANPRRRTPKE